MKEVDNAYITPKPIRQHRATLVRIPILTLRSIKMGKPARMKSETTDMTGATSVPQSWLWVTYGKAESTYWRGT